MKTPSPKSNLLLIYWHPSVIRTWLDKVPRDLASHAEMLRRHSRSQGRRLVTLASTEDEILEEFASRPPEEIDLVEQRLQTLWDVEDAPVALISINKVIFAVARELMARVAKEKMVLLKSDVLHIAAASWLGVTQFQTTKQGFERLGRMAHNPFPIQPPDAGQFIFDSEVGRPAISSNPDNGHTPGRMRSDIGKHLGDPTDSDDPLAKFLPKAPGGRKQHKS